MDLVIPLQLDTIKLDHEAGGFVLEENPYILRKISCLPLGIVKHRIFWKPNARGEAPLCKSNDGETGYPGPELLKNTVGDYKTRTCANCMFRSDGRRNSADRDEAKCSPEWSLILQDGNNPKRVMVMRLRGTSLWTVSKYAEKYARMKSPMFVKRMEIHCERVQRNQIKYTELEVSQGESTDPKQWDLYLDNYLEARRILTMPPKISAGPSGKSKITPLADLN